MKRVNKFGPDSQPLSATKKKGKPADQKLSPRERVFVSEYLLTNKCEHSARAAGYAETTCKSKAYTWVKEGKCPINKIHVLRAIQAQMEERSKKTNIDAIWVLKRLGMIADFNINRFLKIKLDGSAEYDFREATDDDWYCISEITIEQITKGTGDDVYDVERVKVKSESKLKALELAGRHVNVGAFKDTLDVNYTDKSEIIRKARERKNAGS